MEMEDKILNLIDSAKIGATPVHEKLNISEYGNSAKFWFESQEDRDRFMGWFTNLIGTITPQFQKGQKLYTVSFAF